MKLWIFVLPTFMKQFGILFIYGMAMCFLMKRQYKFVFRLFFWDNDKVKDAEEVREKSDPVSNFQRGICGF